MSRGGRARARTLARGSGCKGSLNLRSSVHRMPRRRRLHHHASTISLRLRRDLFYSTELFIYTVVDRDPRILQFTVDLQYCRIFFCTAGRARAQI